MITAIRRWIARGMALLVLVCTLGAVRVQFNGVVADSNREAQRDGIISVQ